MVTNPHYLDYSPSTLTILPRPIRFFLIGPMTGAIIGCFHTCMAAVMWILLEHPDFYFRGGQGIILSFFMMTIGGGLAGILYGSIISFFERKTGRCIRPIIALGITLLISSIINYLILKSQFERQQLDMMLYPEAIAVIVGLIVSIFTSEDFPKDIAE